jgi:signal transduction histidine kinase
MRVQVDLEHAEAAAAVNTDPAAVEQILFNLVDNACKYAACSESKLIRIAPERVSGRSGWIGLRISDDGPGISKQARKRLFQPFSKSATEAAHSAPGVGLGLALSRRMARDMGGDLRLDDTQPGASFVLQLESPQS